MVTLGSLTRRTVVASVLVAAGIFVAGVETFGRSSHLVTLPQKPPPGFVVQPSINPPSGTGLQEAYFLHADHEPGGLKVQIRSFPSVIVERLVSLRLVPPGHLKDLDPGQTRETGIGVGIGSDTIRCNAYLANDCLEWVYWSHNGVDLITVGHLRDTSPFLSLEEFRALVTEVLGGAR